MPKAAAELRPAEIPNLPPGAHAAGTIPGLMLSVSPDGASRSWGLRYISPTTGKRRQMGLGSWPSVTLAQARERGRQAREVISSQRDPIDERERAGVEAARAEGKRKTFSVCTAELIADKSEGWKSPKSGQQWANSLATHAAALMPMDVASIDTEDVLKVLRPIWKTKHPTASRIRQRVERVLGYAMAISARPRGFNPATWDDNIALSLQPSEKVHQEKHHAAMGLDATPLFYRRLAQARENAVTAHALRFLMLTAARCSEVRGAIWAEFDLERALWTVGPARMKGGKPHRVPLQEEALAVLRMRPRGGPADLVFANGTSGEMLSEDAFRMAIRKRGDPSATAHGFRAVFGDWVRERSEFHVVLADAQLAHLSGETSEATMAHMMGGEVTRAYVRGDVLPKRREMMSAWAAFLTGADDEATALAEQLVAEAS